MNPKPSREETLFFAAAEMATPEMRAAFLDRNCADALGTSTGGWAVSEVKLKRLEAGKK